MPRWVNIKKYSTSLLEVSEPVWQGACMRRGRCRRRCDADGVFPSNVQSFWLNINLIHLITLAELFDVYFWLVRFWTGGRKPPCPPLDYFIQNSITNLINVLGVSHTNFLFCKNLFWIKFCNSLIFRESICSPLQSNPIYLWNNEK